MIVLPMAGLSHRFTAAGYDRPKYALPLAGRPVFDWALLSFRRAFGHEPLLFVCRDLPGQQAFLEERLSANGVADARILTLQAPTEGQAETVARGLEWAGIGVDEPVSVFNIDTFRPGLSVPANPGLAGSDGYLETFLGDGTHWSFVEPVAPGSDRAGRVVEKTRISDYCSTGLYYFAKASLYERAYEREQAARSSHELFVAPLYQHLITDGCDIRFTVIDGSDVFFCGTPAEYQNMQTREAELISAFGT
jgi:dTDP-glucose pyrophosphorylase